MIGTLFMSGREKMQFISINGYNKEFLIWADFKRPIESIELELREKIELPSNYAINLYFKSRNFRNELLNSI